jgi:hypothetical protein
LKKLREIIDNNSSSNLSWEDSVIKPIFNYLFQEQVASLNNTKQKSTFDMVSITKTRPLEYDDQIIGDFDVLNNHNDSNPLKLAKYHV